ncbi:MAG: hypothetical protein J4F28_07920 [Nitrosopumilaceae archaeon]|nr:hypothetical protein [Nitrosopumilaceae archaeon]
MHNPHSMETKSKLRVHIAPLGFEVDRIVLPAIRLRADAVWLLVHSNRSEDKAEPFEAEIRERLGRKGIEVKVEYADRKNLFGMLKAVRGIIAGGAEGGGNDIYVNVSSGSKIQSIACMMACMMWNDTASLTPYYAEPEGYTSSAEPSGRAPADGGGDGDAGTPAPEQMSRGLKSITTLPKYRIQTPRQDLVRALAIVSKAEGGRIRKGEMAERAEELGIITVNSREENRESARFASLAKNIVEPLTDEWNFLRVEKVGRTRWVSLTEEGRNAAEFLL